MKRLFVLAAAFLTAASAAAQTGSLGGFATADGRRAPRVTVTAQSLELQRPREAVTSKRGTYWIANLPAGTYDVTFALPRHQTVTLRAEVREGEQTRLDAALAPSDDEESVTRTGGTRSVGERPQLAWTLEEELAEKLPLDRMTTAALALSPAPQVPLLTRIGGIVSRAPLALHRDAARDLTVVHAAPSAEVPEVTRLFVTPRNGSEDAASVRSTLERAGGATSALHEITFGTPLSDSIWTFLSAAGSPELRQVFANVDVSPTKRDTATLTLLASDVRGSEPFGVTWTHAQRRFTTIGHAGNTNLSLTASTLLFRSHEVSAGVEHLDEKAFANTARTAGFIRDRWVVTPRIAVEAGARLMAGFLQPRAGAVVDLGSGVRLAAAWSRILDPFAALASDEVMVSLARPVSSSGYARAALVSSSGVTGRDAMLFDASGRYLIFAYGATVALERDDDHGSHGAAWLQIDFPTIGYDLSLAALERWRPGTFDTDLALRYALERERFTPFVGIDVVNVFERREDRLYRASLGLRM